MSYLNTCMYEIYNDQVTGTGISFTLNCHFTVLGASIVIPSSYFEMYI